MIDQKTVCSLLSYSQDTGAFTWLVQASQRTKVGMIAGCVDRQGYRRIGINHNRYAAHRLAWLYVNGAWPSNGIDHIDGNKSNNRLNNLRDVSQSMNMQNLYIANIDSRTGFLGVTKNRHRYRAQISVGGQMRNLGSYDSPELAHQAYLAFKRKHHPGNTL